MLTVAILAITEYMLHEVPSFIFKDDLHVVDLQKECISSAIKYTAPTIVFSRSSEIQHGGSSAFAHVNKSLREKIRKGSTISIEGNIKTLLLNSNPNITSGLNVEEYSESKSYQVDIRSEEVNLRNTDDNDITTFKSLPVHYKDNHFYKYSEGPELPADGVLNVVDNMEEDEDHADESRDRNKLNFIEENEGLFNSNIDRNNELEGSIEIVVNEKIESLVQNVIINLQNESINKSSKSDDVLSSCVNDNTRGFDSQNKVILSENIESIDGIKAEEEESHRSVIGNEMEEEGTAEREEEEQLKSIGDKEDECVEEKLITGNDEETIEEEEEKSGTADDKETVESDEEKLKSNDDIIKEKVEEKNNANDDEERVEKEEQQVTHWNSNDQEPVPNNGRGNYQGENVAEANYDDDLTTEVDFNCLLVPTIDQRRASSQPISSRLSSLLTDRTSDDENFKISSFGASHYSNFGPFTDDVLPKSTVDPFKTIDNLLFFDESTKSSSYESVLSHQSWLPEQTETAKNQLVDGFVAAPKSRSKDVSKHSKEGLSDTSATSPQLNGLKSFKSTQHHLGRSSTTESHIYCNIPRNGLIMTTSSLTDVLILCTQLISFSKTVCSLVLPSSDRHQLGITKEVQQQYNDSRADTLVKVLAVCIILSYFI